MDLRKIARGVTKFFMGWRSTGSIMWNWSLPGQWGKEQLIRQYTRYVYPIVAAISENAAKADFKVERQLETTVSPQIKHPFLTLLKRPNPMQSQFQFLEMHYTFMKLCGESYWYIVRGENSKKPKMLILLRPDMMKVVVDESSNNPLGLVTGYVMKRNGVDVPFEKDEILHHKMPNPFDPYYGYGPIEAAKIYIETEEYTSKWTRNSIYNSGRPSGVLGLKATMEQGEFNTLKRQFQQEYSGVKNAGRTLLLKGIDDMKYTKLGMDLEGVALKELKDMSRDDIMFIFRMSKTILGITDDVNYSNSQDQKNLFTENIIKPELDRLVDHINAFLMPDFDDRDVLKYIDPVTKTDKEKLEMYKSGHNKWLTTNDIRNELGMEPLIGGNVIREPVNLLPTSETQSKSAKKKTLKSPACRIDGESKKQCIARKLPEILRENPGMTQDQAVAMASSMCSKPCKQKSLNQDRVNVFKQMFFDNQVLWENRYKEFMQGEFKTQLKEILDKKKKEAFTDWHFNLLASKGRIIATLIPFGYELMKEAAKFAFDLADDPDNELIINQKVREYIRARIDKLADETNDFTINEIEQTIAEGVANGDSVKKLRDRIRNVYDNADKVRAERIARTETLAASNEGANEAYIQSPLVKYKEWSTEIDGCEFCQALDGKIIGVNSDFALTGQAVDGDEGGKYHVDYTDIKHPPLHPNCKCSILPVAE